MTYTYRLARRLARLRAVAWVSGCSIIFACQQGGELKEGFGPPDPPAPTVSEVRLTPSSVVLVPGGIQQFTSTGLMSDGTIATVPVTYLAEGGSVTPEGRYTAGTAPGTYRLMAIGPGGLADTASLTVSSAPPVPLVAVDLSPASLTLTPGATQQFLTTGRRSDGSNTTVTVDYTAGGGSITAAGLFTAGQTVGAFPVIATETTSGLADTAAVTIAVAPTDQPPTAEANGPYSGTVGAPIQFSNAGSFDSEGAWTAAWDFGDGATSSGSNPSHSYTSTGSYTVTLTVTDQSNQSTSDVATATVTGGPPPPVDQPPTAQANGPYSGTPGTAVQFSSAGSSDPEGAWSAAWTFGDGATSSALNPSHTYAAAGSYNVTLTVTDQANQTASSNATATITGGPPPPVDQPPTAQANGPYSGTVGTAIQLSSAGSLDSEGAWTGAWNFGDGGTSTALNPSHTYAVAGSYTVTLTVTDQAGQTASDNTSATITGGTPPPPPTGGAYPNEPAGAIVLMDYDTDFSNLSNPPWGYVGGAGNLTTITDPTAPVDPSKVGRVTFPRGCCNGAGTARLETYSGNGGGSPPGSWSQWYVADWIKFDSDFQPHNFMKIFEFFIDGSGGDNWTLIKADGGGSFPLSPRITIEWSNSVQNLGNGAVQMQPEIWYQYEMIHHSSGRLQLWMRQQGGNPVQIYDGTPANFQGSATSNKYLFWWWGYGGLGAYPLSGGGTGPGYVYHNHFRTSYLP
jgi:PKD repeat protein